MSNIKDRFKTVLKSTGTLGEASAGLFVDNFCDEVERQSKMNTEQKYRITRIDEPEFGCEGRLDGKPAMAVVFLQDEQGREKVISYNDAELYRLDLNEEDFCYYINEERLIKA